MTSDWTATQVDEAVLGRLAERIALKLRPADTIALHGELGAGKTTFARALIRAMLSDANAEVPSPTFSLVQTYDTPRLRLAHLDLYRLGHADEAMELGTDEMLSSGALIVEWPERAPSLLSNDRLDIYLSETGNAADRDVRITASGSWRPRLKRTAALCYFLDAQPEWRTASVSYLQGDASPRAYARLYLPAKTAILMDSPRQPDGRPVRNGLPYSRIAHLAEDVRPFVAVAAALRDANLSVPDIHAADLDHGFVLMEDFGDRVFGQEMLASTPQAELWRAGVDALLVLRHTSVPASIPLADGSAHVVPAQDRAALAIETDLLADWYWPSIHGAAMPDEVRAELSSLWNRVFDQLLTMPTGWALRDYHSPNLVWLPDRKGARRAGLLDFQDALQAPLAYDLVSLLQDARVDVPIELEQILFAHYCEATRSADPQFDETTFRYAYAALGAQRNTKILGIFARLWKRDGKPGYLRHIPRIWGYLERDLAHRDLAPLRNWYDRHFSAALRTRIPIA